MVIFCHTALIRLLRDIIKNKIENYLIWILTIATYKNNYLLSQKLKRLENGELNHLTKTPLLWT